MIFNLIQAIANKDEMASTVFEDILRNKLAEQLDYKRIELATVIFENMDDNGIIQAPNAVKQQMAKKKAKEEAIEASKDSAEDDSSDDQDDNDVDREDASDDNESDNVKPGSSKVQKQVKESLLDEAKRQDRFHIITKEGKPANLTSYATLSAAKADRDTNHPGAVIHQVGSRGSVKHVFESAELDEASSTAYSGHQIYDRGDHHTIRWAGEGHSKKKYSSLEDAKAAIDKSNNTTTSVDSLKTYTGPAPKSSLLNKIMKRRQANESIEIVEQNRIVQAIHSNHISEKDAEVAYGFERGSPKEKAVNRAIKKSEKVSERKISSDVTHTHYKHESGNNFTIIKDKRSKWPSLGALKYYVSSHHTSKVMGTHPNDIKESVEIEEMAMASLSHPTHGKLAWENNKGVHQITKNGKPVFSGSHEEVAKRWSAIKKTISEDVSAHEWEELSETVWLYHEAKPNAEAASKTADEASANFEHFSKNGGNHYQAAKLHHEANWMHMKAGESAERFGSKKDVNYHDKMYSHHLKMAWHHEAEASKEREPLHKELEASYQRELARKREARAAARAAKQAAESSSN